MTSYITPEEIAEWALSASEKEIDFLQNVIAVRRTEFRENRAALNQHTMYVGDRIKVRDDLRPKKIASKTGYIIGVDDKGNFKVELDFPPDSAWRVFTAEPWQVEKT